MKIPDKDTFNRLSQAGKVGNYLRTWQTEDEVRSSGYGEWLTIRSHDKQSPFFLPAITVGEYGIRREGYLTMSMAVIHLVHKGADKSRLYFQEIPPPDARRVIQFEAMLGPQWTGAGAGVEMVYELDTDSPVRGIRERGQAASGLKAQALLRHYLSPGSYDTLYDLWEQYPAAIVEFSEFDRAVGAFQQPGVVWELRDY